MLVNSDTVTLRGGGGGSVRIKSIININNNNTQIAAIALPPSTTHPQLWAELLTRKPKFTITRSLTRESIKSAL